VVDTVQMRHILRGTADVRGKIARLINSGELFQLRRGLYATRRDVEPLCLAGPIYGPSYVSFETALSWHGMIPEGVAEITSSSTRRSASFENEFGRFRYVQIPSSVYPVGILRITDAAIPFLIASPTKAVCDRIAREPGFRSMTDISRWLEDMRIDLEKPLDGAELASCAENYGSPAVRLLLRFGSKGGLTQ
jgi:hypothetical protein